MALTELAQGLLRLGVHPLQIAKRTRLPPPHAQAVVQASHRATVAGAQPARVAEAET